MKHKYCLIPRYRRLMPTVSPRAWPWSASNSPEPFPDGAWVQSLAAIHPLSLDDEVKKVDSLSLRDLKSWLQGQDVELEDGSTETLESWLAKSRMTPVEERLAFLLPGELANPNRLVDLAISGMPIIPVRMDGVCRVWTDVIDGREVSPGIHHITLARTDGWWETTWLGLPDMEQAQSMTRWLNDGMGTAWRWSKIAEGQLSLHIGEIIYPPNPEMVNWNGEIEKVESKAPSRSGPLLDWSEIKVILFTRQGCYDNRGRLARCCHIRQRQFHTDMFRRGSAKQWDEIIDIG